MMNGWRQGASHSPGDRKTARILCDAVSNLPGTMRNPGFLLTPGLMFSSGASRTSFSTDQSLAPHGTGYVQLRALCAEPWIECLIRYQDSHRDDRQDRRDA